MLRGRSVADPPDDPVVVEAMGELPEGPVEFLDGVEGPEPEELFLEGSDEPFDATVPFGLADEGRAGGDADGLELVLEGVGDELASVVVPEAGSEGDVDLVASLGGVDGLPEALDGLEACSAECGPSAEALSGAVVDDDEDGGVALGGEASGGVDGPHPVGGLGRDGAIVGVRPADADRPVAGEEAVLPHDPEDASHGGADAALVAEPCPDLAVTFADEEGGAEHGADLGEEFPVVEEALWAAFGVGCGPVPDRGLEPLDGGAGDPPREADASDAVGPVRGG